jgi:hypothetical protein
VGFLFVGGATLVKIAAVAIALIIKRDLTEWGLSFNFQATLVKITAVAIAICLKII